MEAHKGRKRPDIAPWSGTRTLIIDWPVWPTILLNMGWRGGGTKQNEKSRKNFVI